MKIRLMVLILIFCSSFIECSFAAMNTGDIISAKVNGGPNVNVLVGNFVQTNSVSFYDYDIPGDSFDKYGEPATPGETFLVYDNGRAFEYVAGYIYYTGSNYTSWTYTSNQFYGTITTEEPTYPPPECPDPLNSSCFTPPSTQEGFPQEKCPTDQGFVGESQ